MSPLRKVFIYHPSKYLGGSEVLFSRIALIYKDAAECEVIIIDHTQDSAIKKALGIRANDFVFLDFESKDFYGLLADGLVVASARNIIRFYSERPSSYQYIEHSAVFWALHPAELYAQIGIGYDRIKKFFGYQGVRLFYKMNPIGFVFKRVLDKLLKQSSLFFMDRSVLQESQWVMDYEVKNPKFLHLFSGLESIGNTLKSEGVPLRPIILSRLDSFKLPSVYRLLDDYNALAKAGLWGGELTIVGDGKALEELKSYCKQILFKVNFSGHVPIDKLRRFLIEGQFDLFFGMGMSLLEGASLGIPCVVIPASERRIKERNCYALLSVGSDSLGEYFESPVKHLPYESLSSVLNAVGSDWSISSERSVEFFEKYYSRAVTKQELLNLLERPSIAGGISIPKVFSILSFWRKFNQV